MSNNFSKKMLALLICSLTVSAAADNDVELTNLKVIDLCKEESCTQEFKTEFTKAMDGNAQAQNLAGEMLLFGKGVAKNFRAARVLFLQASSQGQVVAANHLGRLYLNGEGVEKDETEACKWYRVAADRKEPSGLQNAKWCQSKGL